MVHILPIVRIKSSGRIEDEVKSYKQALFKFLFLEISEKDSFVE